MKISIVMPSLNHREFLAAALESVLGQEGAFELETTVVDGGSTDGTVQILESMDDPRLTWTSGPDRGQTDAINRGLSRVTGEIVGKAPRGFSLRGRRLPGEEPLLWEKP